MNLDCVLESDKHGCMQAIDNEKADLVTLDPGEVYIGGRYYSLAAVLAEKYSSSRTGYFAVAAVKSSSNISSLEDLRGRKVCFSGIGHMAGWVIPISTLLEKEIMPVVDCNNLVKTASVFFGPSCAPNSLNDQYNPTGDNSLKMCELCAGWRNGRGTHCSGSDLFAGYEGAFKCMADGNGEIAFMTQNAVVEMINNGGYRKSDFSLLCTDGSLRSVDTYATCNWGSVPSHAIVASSSVSGNRRKKLQDMLMLAAKLFSNYGEEKKTSIDRYSPTNSWSSWSNFVTTTTRRPRPVNEKDFKSDFKLFVSTPIYGNYTSLMFQDTSEGFDRVSEERQTFARYLGKKYVDKIKQLRTCHIASMTLCVVTEKALKKCYQMRTALQAKDLKPDLYCVRADSDRACMGMLKQRIADVTVLEAGDIYQAGQKFDLKPIVAEQYNIDEPVYYVVAIAQASDPDTDLLFLKGKRSCHTGVGTAAGWIIPINFLTKNNLMRQYGCNSIRAASEYFQKSCAPGAMSGEFAGASSQYINLCDLCHGSKSQFCKRDGIEPFYGHTGALRCLVEGGGEVAFLKHTTISENTDGKNKDIWIRNMIKGDFELLCRDGTRSSVDQFASCNLGKVASNAIVAREDDPDSIIEAYINVFMYAQQYYGHGSNYENSFSFPMFGSPVDSSDLIFQDATELLKAIPKEKQNYKDYLGKEFLRAVENTDCTAGCANNRFSVILYSFTVILVVKLIAY
ncbi:Melanotransferrin [Nymphon striatum]|nr:Melanotransferrin [Nymphon striatum]